MSLNSQDLFLRSKKLTPGGVHSPVRSWKSVDSEPVFFKSANGAYIESVEGQKYVDFCQSFGPNILGHRDPDVATVVKEMEQTAWTLGAADPYSLELAEWIVSRVRCIDKVRFVCSGTEAVMTALRIARAATGRSGILKFDGCYHGHVDSMLVKAGSGLAGEACSDSAGVPEEFAQTTYIAQLNDIDSVKNVIEKHGSSLAAIIIEPLPANYGLLIQKEEFLREVMGLAKNNGSLVIFDEVISGFRVGMEGMAGLLNVKPDLLTYGKIIGGGFPVGAYGGRSDLMDMIAPAGPVYQAGTLSANPIGMTAGLATLKKVEDQQVHKKLEERTAKFCGELNHHFDRQGLDVQATGFHSLFWMHKKSDGPIRNLKDIPSGHPEQFTKMFHNLFNHGVYLAPSGFEVGFMSYAHDEELLEQVVEKIVKAFKG